MNKAWLSVVLMAVYPIIILASGNIGEVVFHDLLWPLISSVALSLLLYMLVSKLTGDKYISALAVVITLVFFYFYGHFFYSYISGKQLLEVTIGRHRFFYPVWGAGYLLVLYVIFKGRQMSSEIVKFLNYTLSFLLLVTLLPLLAGGAFSLFDTASMPAPSNDSAKNNSSEQVAHSNEYPDIYYIVLDGYAADETLLNVYNYDNSDFTNELRSKGFFIADRALANHSYTYLALNASLNMMYMDFLGKEGHEATLNELGDKIGNNKVARELKKQGYRYVTYDSGYSVTARNSLADQNIGCALLSEFDRTLIRTTMLDPFFLYGGIRERILCQFSSLATVDQSGPDFVFAHIIAPHPPFVFDKDGGTVSMNAELNPWSNKQDYVNQLQFTNVKVRELVDRIIEQHEQPPIIIIQSDHGPASSGTEEMNDPSITLLKERMRVLNMFYVPDDIRSKLYREITPINTFRLILDELFDTEYGLVEDKSLFTPIGKAKKTFDDVTEFVRYE